MRNFIAKAQWENVLLLVSFGTLGVVSLLLGDTPIALAMISAFLIGEYIGGRNPAVPRTEDMEPPYIPDADNS
jgi:hypothetical protein